MKIEEWFKLANKVLERSKELTNKATQWNTSVINIINSVGKTVSNQWMNTHKVASDQVEEGLKTQSNMINQQYDVFYFI